MATVLATIQDACKLMGRAATAAVPSAVFASADTFARELAGVSNEAATYIMKQHDWRLLTTLKTQAGDGSDTSFPLPSDYDRMPVKAAVFRASTTRPMVGIQDLDTWQFNRLQSLSNPTGEWILLGGELQIYPALASTDSAKFYYISNKFATAVDAVTTKAAFTVDTDTFRLGDRLLKLAIIWRWRALKGLDYAEDMQNFEIAFAQEIARDKGARRIVIGKARIPDGVQLAYPGTIDA